mmetsp:Transcript_116797/g.184704  ORF Transcript_116797/g.184704 Transcript_116797/m.184704 type:complete len:248 (+) Transcript_116797:1-744(+)
MGGSSTCQYRGCSLEFSPQSQKNQPSAMSEAKKSDTPAVQLKEFFYLANIIDYGRIVFLYLAVSADSGWKFACYYTLSYALDAIDGMVARAMKQTSKLGYWLDMVIDRISSCVCLYLAAKAVQDGSTFIPVLVAPPVAYTLLASIVLVEILSHGVVMFMAEFSGAHQKELGFEYTVVRWYLSKKSVLLWACASFEAFGLGLITNLAPIVLISAPGFLFRAVANCTRLLAVITSDNTNLANEDDKKAH